eukprot:6031473-Amphidinium_carterae.2
MQRAIPLRRNEHVLTFETYRGKTKQDGERSSFVWHVPRTGPLGCHFAGIVWDSFRRFQSPTVDRSFLACDHHIGTSVGLFAFTETINRVFHGGPRGRAPLHLLFVEAVPLFVISARLHTKKG